MMIRSTLRTTCMSALLPALALTAGHAHGATINAGSLSTFTDASGIDTQGNFLYALSLSDADAGSRSDNTRVIGGLDFEGASGDSVAGVSVSGTTFGGADKVGFSPEDGDLDTLMGTSTYGKPLTINLDVTTGTTYKLQILLAENNFNSPGSRITEIRLEKDGVVAVDDIVVSDLDPLTETGDKSTGVLYSLTFVAPDEKLNIVADAVRDDGSDSAGNFSAVTLEIIPEPATVGLVGVGGLMLLTRRRRN